MRFAVPLAIVRSGLLIAGALVIAPLMTPYRVISGSGSGSWLLNANSGEVRLCVAQVDPYQLTCSRPRIAPSLPAP
jgi:hypothetical protein